MNILNNSARDQEQDYEVSEEPIARDPQRRSSGVQARAERAPSASPIPFIEAAPALISIGAPADSALLEPTYAYLSAYCFACLPPQLAQRLNVAIYELYANALRYGAPGSEVRLELYKTRSGARLVITNSAEPAQRERLELQIARVRRNPQAAFSAEMDRFASGSAAPPMLGIVRVAHESGLGVELSVDAEQVHVSTLCEA
jgi:hypothetical protein